MAYVASPASALPDRRVRSKHEEDSPSTKVQSPSPILLASFTVGELDMRSCNLCTTLGYARDPSISSLSTRALSLTV